jgi:hypothetical protein
MSSKLLAAVAVVLCVASLAVAEKPKGDVVLRVASASSDDPQAAGHAAAESLKQALAGAMPKVVLLSECFEDKANKEQVLAGVTAVFPKQIVLGAATYGSFTHAGCTDADSVCLAALAGSGVAVSTALVTNIGVSHLAYDTNKDVAGQRLRAAGTKLAESLRRTPKDRLLVVLADAHSPKNQPLVEGVQKVLGPKFPITGGCANKNAGQTYVFFDGRLYEDAAVGLMLSGDFQVGLSGRQAKENQAVIRTAGESGQEALGRAKGKPVAALAFNCAGRRSKLQSIAEELASIEKAIGKQLPLFGCYCAGEMGPVDLTDKPAGALCGGSGWHIMFTVISQ